MSLATDGGIIQEAMKKVETLSQKNNSTPCLNDVSKNVTEEEFPKEDEEPEQPEPEDTGEPYE
jgi:hypothetical protein